MMSSRLVCAQMLSVVTGIIEDLVALLTLPRLLARMQVRVDLEVITLREIFATCLALVRLLARVYEHVISQMERTAKLFAALDARKRPNIRMYQLFVAFYIARLVEKLPTFFALIRLVVHVENCVAPQTTTCREHLTADETLERRSLY